MSKKIILIVAIALAIIAVIGCIIILATVGCIKIFAGTEKNVEGDLEGIMTKLYEGIDENNLPMGLANMEITDENVESFIGTSNVEYTEALANESMVGSIAHSVVLVRVNDSKQATLAVEEIKNNVNPRKWICVEASNVFVKSKGNLVLLVMSNEELAPKLEANFDNL
ncbi:MAG: hypothetical protein E7310_07275 [Clostridiales bacterium]|nr:hypothetical protein [Clostridiales bacterium]